MKKVLFLLFILIVPMYAVDSIYTWGYGSDAKEILSGVKMFTSNAGYLISAALAIGMIMVVIKGAAEDQMNQVAKVVFIGVFLSQMFFYSTKTYMLEDEITNQAWSISDVPVGMGELFSITSTVERIILNAFESTFTTPNGLKLSQSGLGFSMGAHLTIQDASFIDGAAHETFMDYTTNCIASGMLDGQITTNMIKSEDIVANLKVTGYETLVYKSDGTIEQMSCQDSYTNYVEPSFRSESNDYINTRLSSQLSLDPAVVKSALEDTSTLFFNVSKSGVDYVEQILAKNMLHKGMKTMAMTTGGDVQALAYGSAVSEATLNNQWQQTGLMAQKTLPMIKGYLFSVLLALTPLLALLAIMFGDWKHIILLINLLLTFILWGPISSIINNLIYLRLEVIIPQLSSGLWMPMLSFKDINSNITFYLNFLVYATMAIPLLSYSIIKGSEMGFVNFMTSLGGAVSGGANAGANQKTTGANIGNTRVNAGQVVNEHGTTSTMGNNTYQNSGVGGSGYTYQESRGLNGKTNSTLNNSVADVSMQDGSISSVGYKNIGADLSNNHQASRNEAVASEKSALSTLSGTLSSGITQSMANGQIYTTAEDLSKNSGMNLTDSRSIIEAENQAKVKTINERISESQSNGTTADSAFKINGHAGLGTKGTLVETLTGVKAGIDGSMQYSGTTTDGRSFTYDVSKDESQQFQKSTSDNLSKVFNEDSGLALRASQALADNEVFSDTDIKSQMQAYTAAHQTADKYSDSYNKTDSTSTNFVSKVMPKVTEDFIENDKDLRAKYHSGVPGAIRDAVDNATNRIDKAYQAGGGVDYRALNRSFENVTGFNLKGDVAKDVDQKISEGKDTLNNTDQIINDGKDQVEKNEVKNSIDASPKQAFKNESADFKTAAQNSMDKHKENIDLNTKESIDTKGEMVEQRRDNFNNDSDVGKSLKGVAGRTGDIYNGIWEINNALSTDGMDKVKSPEKLTEDFIDKTYDKAQDMGVINSHFISDYTIDDPSKLNQLSDKELHALNDKDRSFYHLDENSRDIVKDEILARETKAVNSNELSVENSNISNHEIPLDQINRATIKTTTPSPKDEIDNNIAEDTTDEQTAPQSAANQSQAQNSVNSIQSDQQANVDQTQTIQPTEQPKADQVQQTAATQPAAQIDQTKVDLPTVQTGQPTQTVIPGTDAQNTQIVDQPRSAQDVRSINSDTNSNRGLNQTASPSPKDEIDNNIAEDTTDEQTAPQTTKNDIQSKVSNSAQIDQSLQTEQPKVDHTHTPQQFATTQSTAVIDKIKADLPTVITSGVTTQPISTDQVQSTQPTLSSEVTASQANQIDKNDLSKVHHEAKELNEALKQKISSTKNTPNLKDDSSTTREPLTENGTSSSSTREALDELKYQLRDVQDEMETSSLNSAKPQIKTKKD